MAVLGSEELKFIEPGEEVMVTSCKSTFSNRFGVGWDRSSISVGTGAVRIR